MKKLTKILIFANIPAPYRVTLFNELNSLSNIEIVVLYCASTEKERNWKNLNIKHQHKILRQNKITKLLKIKYHNKNIISSILSFSPDIILTGGFFPTMFLVILVSRIRRIKHFINTDAWELTEKQYKWYHILIRKQVYKSVCAFLPVSEKGEQNFIKNYNIAKKKIFKVNYAVDNLVYSFKSIKKEYDLIFIGQMIERKLPFFATEVIRELKKRRNNLKIAVIGDGPLRSRVLNELKKMEVDYTYLGYLQPDKIVSYYRKSRILLFPTQMDGWGVVANEAIAVGVPVITNKEAGCADELVIDGYSGFVRDLEVSEWTNSLDYYLGSTSLQYKMKENCLNQADLFSTDIACQNFLSAIKYCNNYDE